MRNDRTSLISSWICIQENYLWSIVSHQGNGSKTELVSCAQYELVVIAKTHYATVNLTERLTFQFVHYKVEQSYYALREV